ncbi:general transcriptional corepressor trfA-like [Oppia nitens]|uniref:general transcriptional corepressor trfA-like n=1 Tax=Oppia nitens TaxID=1686743 RepID=UPI0023DCAB68|nr:general transcriptional corepressor trfA-like [Oppia nitens]
MSYKNNDEKLSRISKTLWASKTFQTRFKIRLLNGKTHIRDMNLGKIGKNGKRKGIDTIRFDKPHGKYDHHINIDPRGFPSKKNPHIPIPKSVSKGFRYTCQAYQYVTFGLGALSIAYDGYQLGKSAYDYIHIEDIIEELEEILSALREDLKSVTDIDTIDCIHEAIEYYESELEACKRSRGKVPCKLIKTGASVSGSWFGGAAGALAGGWAGAQAGTGIGLLFGPAGVAVAAPVCAFAGALAGAIKVSNVTTEFAENLAESYLDQLEPIDKKSSDNISANDSVSETANVIDIGLDITDKNLDNISDNNSDNNLDNKADNNSDNKADNNSDNKADNNLDNKADNNSDNKADNNSDNKADNGLDKQTDNEMDNRCIILLVKVLDYML